MAERPTRKPSAPASGRSTVDPALPHKKRARRRVIGAAALLLVAAIVLPLVLESEPRAPTPDLIMRIPPRDAEPPAKAGTGDSAAAASTSVAEPLGSGAVGTDDAKPAEQKAVDSKGGESKAVEAKAAEQKAAEQKTAEQKALEQKAPEQKAGADTKSSDAYWVQVGAFRSEDAATRAADSARAAGLTPRAEKVAASSGSVTRVRVGPFRDRDAASRARDQLKSRGIEAAIIAP